VIDIMPFYMRQDVRNLISRTAWISVGDVLPLIKCKLIDLSDSGAKLALEDIEGLPDRFSLWLSRQGCPRYTCRLVWSRENIIGVHFSSAADDRREPAVDQQSGSS
jgi:hypothetical protein